MKTVSTIDIPIEAQLDELLGREVRAGFYTLGVFFVMSGKLVCRLVDRYGVVVKSSPSDGPVDAMVYFNADNVIRITDDYVPYITLGPKRRQ